MPTPTSIARSGALLLAALALALTLDAPRDAEAFPPLAPGLIETVAGGGSSLLLDGLPARQVQLSVPDNLAVDGQGNLIVVAGHRVLRIEATTNATTVVPAGTLMFVRALE